MSTTVSPVRRPSPVEPTAYFLVIDRRYSVPVYVFLESDPVSDEDYDGPPARAVTLAPAVKPTRPDGYGIRTEGTVGADPRREDRFAEFRSDGQAQAAGFALIEPRYIGRDWQSYSAAFRPEGGPRSSKRAKAT